MRPSVPGMVKRGLDRYATILTLVPGLGVTFGAGPGLGFGAGLGLGLTVTSVPGFGLMFGPMPALTFAARSVAKPACCIRSCSASSSANWSLPMPTSGAAKNGLFTISKNSSSVAKLASIGGVGTCAGTGLVLKTGDLKIGDTGRVMTGQLPVFSPDPAASVS